MVCRKYNRQKYSLHLKQKEVRRLDGEYKDKAREIPNEYKIALKNGDLKKQIEIQLANRRVYILRKKSVEKMLFKKLDNKNRTQEIKIDKNRKEVIEDELCYLQDMIWKIEEKIYKLYKEIPQSDPQKDKIKERFDNEKIYDWPYGVECTQPEHYTYALTPFNRVMTIITYSGIYFVEYLEIEKKRVELFNTPRSNEYEMIWLAYYSRRIKELRRQMYEAACRIYFRELPIDHPRRQNVRKLILGPRYTFGLVLRNMLYDSSTDDYAVWSNFKELISVDRELQFILEGLNRKCPHNPVLDRVDIIEFIRQSPMTTFAKDILNKIPPNVLEQRKELFEEIIRSEYWEYIHCNYTFELTSLANMTTLNSNDTYERDWDKF